MTYKRAQQEKVLVVDDDVILRDVLSLLLGAEGYDVQCAESGEDALRLLAAEREVVSIVLTDMHMPGIHGTALAEKLQAAVPPGTVIVGMSGSQPTAEEKAAFRAFLEKPFSAEAFSAAVERARTDQQSHSRSQAPNAPQFRVLNEEVYARMASIMPQQQLRELYCMTLDDVRRRVRLMQEAVARGDNATCRAEAHSIKGGCGMVGAAEISAMATEMERAVEPELTTLAEFGAACGRLEDMLDARIGRVGPITDGEL